LLWCPALASAQTPDPATQTFSNRRNTFRIDLPADWRQLAPAEVAALERAVPALPADVAANEPALFYAVGPIDRWLQGEFDGTYLYVVEQRNEWVLDDRLAERLQDQWQQMGARNGHRYELADVQSTVVSTARHPAVTCTRTITPPQGRMRRSLDVHVPTGGRELTLCFTCWADEFEGRLPRFLGMLDTLVLAQRARGTSDLGDRLWTPIIAGIVVGLALAALYRRTRSRPP
jgi:hypothetical protein